MEVSTKVGRQKWPSHRRIHPKEVFIRRQVLDLRLQDPSHGAQIVALVGVVEKASVGREEREARDGIWPFWVLLENDDVVAAIVGLYAVFDEVGEVMDVLRV